MKSFCSFSRIGLLVLSLFSAAWTTPEVQAMENPLFNYTHLLPSPFTLPRGALLLGTTTGVGITNSLEMDTNVVADIFQVFNLNARLSVLDFPGLALGVNLGFEYMNLNTFSSLNPSVGIPALLPGAVVGAEIAPYVALFFGGNLFFPTVTLPTAAVNSAYLQGGQIETDLSWAYNPDHGQISNAIAIGATYNTTFNFYGVGISHHWRHFHIGFHYYPNANTDNFLPILSGGMAVEI